MWLRTPSITKHATAFIASTFRRQLSQLPAATPQARRVAEIAKEIQGTAQDNDPIAVIASGPRGSPSVTALVRDLAKSEGRPTTLSAVDADSVQAAVFHSASHGGALTSKTRPSNGLPPWLALYVLYHKARSPQDIVVALDLVRRTLPSLPSAVSDALTVLTVAELAHNKLTASMREFVQRFCAAPHRSSKIHYNLLLRAISLHPKSNETGALVRQVFEKMAQHGIKARKQTLNALLHPDFLTLEVASAVEQKMAQDEVAPTRYQLQCLCQLMIAHRYRAKAARYLRKLKLKTKEEKAAWTGPDKLLQARFIRAFRRPTLALEYLTRLVTSRNRRARGMRRWRKPVVDVHQWLYTLHVASRSPHVPSADLLDTFRKSASAYSLSRAAYSTVIRGLLSKRDYANAGTLWEEAFSHTLPSNMWTVSVGASVLTMNGQPDRAFQLLEDVHKAHSAAAGKRRHAGVSLRALHQFMVSLHRMGRPDVVFSLFDHMDTMYSLHPDVYTINILLQTARWARKFEDTIRGQLAVLGFELSPRPSEARSSDDPRAQPVSRIAALLDPTRRSWVTGRWNSEPAGQLALKHALQVFLGNWPWLSDVEPPVQALRRAGEDAARRPLSEAINRTVERAPYETSPLLALLPTAPGAVYPEVMPTDVTFRTLVDLLAAQALHAEIPRVLAWMRALALAPSRTTLATALVHWVDVSMDAPFIERLKGRARRDPYAQLMAWMQDWVGAERMPRSEEMAEEMRRAAYYRDVNYTEIIKERNSEAAARRTT